MLKLIVPSEEYYDEETNTFSQTKDYVLQLEHSLVSISKWESKWKKPYISKAKKTYQERCDYVRCMTITQNIPPHVYRNLTEAALARVDLYMADPMSATTIRSIKGKGGGGSSSITSETVYYWMIQYGIPFSCEKWNFNRLMALINICGRKVSNQGKKPNGKHLMQQMYDLNEKRKAQFHTKG